MDLIDLDECVVNALELFEKGLPEFSLPQFNRPLIVGSGNAAVTGKILFEDRDVISADESTYEVKRGFDGAVLISASAGKHAPVIASKLKEKGIKTVLLTNNPAAQSLVETVHVFPKNPEPYTYNTSTYMGMILAKSREDPEKIKVFLNHMHIPDLSEYDAFFFILPNRFDSIREMLLTKFDELFGPIISARAFTEDQTKHAKTLVPSDKELFVGLGLQNDIWGTKQHNIELPQGFGYGWLMATAYYFIGKIQRSNPAYFKEHIEEYTRKSSELFGQDIRPIVE